MASITHQVWIRSTSKNVYDAVTQQSGLSQWWIKKVTAKPEVGFINLYDEGPSGITPMEIISLRPYNFVEWRCLLENDEWTDTLISFEIIEKNGAVILNFSQSGWSEQSEYFSLCNFHWARHLLTLKTYCETGKGLQDISTKENWGELSKLLS